MATFADLKKAVDDGKATLAADEAKLASDQAVVATDQAQIAIDKAALDAANEAWVKAVEAEKGLVDPTPPSYGVFTVYLPDGNGGVSEVTLPALNQAVPAPAPAPPPAAS